MKKGSFQRGIILFIILLIPLFVIKEYRVFRASKERPITSERTIPTSVEKKSFVVISYGRNNLQYVDKHFDSILHQDYEKFRIVHIDDRSDDGTYEQILQYFSEKKPAQLVEVLQTGENQSVLDLYCEVVKQCDDDEIIIHLEGNDWLFNRSVLSRLNHIYSNKGVWLTYSQYLEYPTYKKGKKEPLPKRALTSKRMQKYPWVTSPLKTYYAKVFKQLCFEDCLHDHTKTLHHKAYLLMEPMVKMAKHHIRYIPEVLYVHNRFSDDPRLDLAGFEKEFAKKIQSKAEMHQIEQSADIIIFSKEYSEHVDQLIRSIFDRVKGNFQIYLFLPKNILPDSFQNNFPKVHLVHMHENEEFKSALLEILLNDESPSHFVIFTTDEVKIEEDISLNECITALMKTRAYGFYFHLGKSIKDGAFSKNSIGDHIYVWSIEKSHFSPDSLKWSLYRKKEIEKDFQDMQFSDTSSLIEAWSKIKRERRLGLFYEKPLIVYYP